MKQKVENEKNKAVKPVPNPETGEVPLTVGIAHKILNDKAKEEKEKKEREENSKKIRDIAISCKNKFIHADLLKREIKINKETKLVAAVDKPYRLSSNEENIEITETGARYLSPKADKELSVI